MNLHTIIPTYSHLNDLYNIIYDYLGTDKGKIIERLRYEMLALLTTKEEDIATTLLMLPFALNSFEDFHEFSLDLEDLVLPG